MTAFPRQSQFFQLTEQEIRSPTRKNFVFMFEYIYQSFGDDSFFLPSSQMEQNNMVSGFDPFPN